MSRGGVEGSSIDPMEGSESNNSMCDLLREAFSATVARDYEKAVSVVRCAVATDYAFGVEDLELMDHVYACILNTSHYDESVIEFGAKEQAVTIALMSNEGEEDEGGVPPKRRKEDEE
ncbi:hypothetical protein TELCIR_00925 [Teladorsagia circumcincta]|uniref:Uncharacterized protein n=1 Tax=Teladorsagia circumcincta TaxID=45464 RepID=A0A2G9V3C2_TELCI|nr:hypothetical protein TELCIR_00925 [Teladorsagia circumcincta]